MHPKEPSQTSQKVTAPSTKTRERVLQAALKAFGHRDYDGVSTRQIVERAGANISAISYHFGGKHGLYLATAAYLAEKLHASHREPMAQIQAEIKEMAPGAADPVRCRQLLQKLLQGFAESILTSELGEDAPGFIFREQNHPTQAFDILYTRLLEPMHTTLTQLVVLIRGLPTSHHREAYLVSHALLGQVIAFRSARATLLRCLNQSSYNTRDIAEITRLVATLANHALDYPDLDQVPLEQPPQKKAAP
ncbi:MAG: CerR family C-terminal domain-containing protein [Magnetococcales bacterium]|nr:CerR family C-terminal domain-containing protein [Magnetococcales bacterium]